jgi:hypothetical protein
MRGTSEEQRMSGGAAPLIAIALRDGTLLRVEVAGVRLGDRLYELERIQDARQVAPDPETFALRVAGSGLVEFQPAHVGDGAVALEALFRLRPDLRPAGFEPPRAPTPEMYPPAPPPYGPAPMGGYLPPPPTAGYGMPPAPSAQGYPPYPPYPSAGYPGSPAPVFVPVGVRSPNTGHGRLTQVPRTFGELLGATFTLLGRRMGSWLTLAIVTALVPAILAGMARITATRLLGLDRLADGQAVFDPSAQSCPFPVIIQPARGDALYQGIAVLAGLVVLAAILDAWAKASLALGTRDAILGRRMAVGSSLAGGLRRLPRTLGASIVVWALTYGLLAPSFVLIAVSFANLRGVDLCATASTSLPDSVAAAAALEVLGTFLLLPATLLALFFAARLGLAPYTAATERIGMWAALGKSWRLTRGSFWRVLGVMLLIFLLVAVAQSVGGQFALASVEIAYLVVVPILALFAMPLTVISRVVLLYDLRLRREGYANVTDAIEAPSEAREEAPRPAQPLG